MTKCFGAHSRPPGSRRIPEMVTPGDMFPDSYKAVFASAPKGSIAVIAVPDQLHYPILKDAVNSNLMFASSNRWF